MQEYIGYLACLFIIITIYLGAGYWSSILNKMEKAEIVMIEDLPATVSLKEDIYSEDCYQAHIISVEDKNKETYITLNSSDEKDKKIIDMYKENAETTFQEIFYLRRGRYFSVCDIASKKDYYKLKKYLSKNANIKSPEEIKKRSKYHKINKYEHIAIVFFVLSFIFLFMLFSIDFITG